eukprot:942601_1
MTVIIIHLLDKKLPRTMENAVLHSVYFSIAQGVSIALVLSALIIQLCIPRQAQVSQNPQDLKKTDRLILITILCNLLFIIAETILSKSGCWQCKILLLVKTQVYLASKLFNYLFCIHRAKLAQELRPTFSKTTFEKTLPIIAVSFVATGSITSVFTLPSANVYCGGYFDTDKLSFCNAVSHTSPLFYVAAIFDTLFTISLLVLFVKPWWKSIKYM